MAIPDGSIIIDTRIDQKGIDTGVKNISKSLGGILNVIKGIGKALVAAFIGGSIINMFRSLVQDFDILGSAVGDKFKPLSEALETLKGAFINLIIQAILPLIPHIISLVQWFTSILQIVTQIVAALFGFDKTVGGIMTKAAAGAKKTAKEARGALAAFDQINVLQKKETPEAPAGAIATPESIAIADDILKKVEALKKLWDEFLQDPLGVLFKILKAIIEDLSGLWRTFIQWVRDNVPFGDVIADILMIVGDTFKKVIANFIETFLKVKENVLKVFQGIRDFLTGVFTGDWKLAWEGLKEIVSGVFGALFAIVEGILNHIGIVLGGMVRILQTLFAPVIEWLREVFEKIKARISDAITGVQAAFGNLAKWFLENVWLPIENGFGSALTGIKKGFETTFNSIKTFLKGIVNTIIDYINGMIAGVVFGINTVIGAANAVGELVGLPEISSITAPRIPKLATGAVIPANSQFLAVLGDQKSGRNIEAPESLIRQIVREETGKMQADISIRFEGSLAQLVRELKPVIDRENVRVGGSLIKSGVTAR